MLPLTPFSCCYHHACHKWKSELACFEPSEGNRPGSIPTALSLHLHTEIHTYAHFLWVWDYCYIEICMQEENKQSHTELNHAAFCVLHHAVTIRIHTDTQNLQMLL